MGKKITTQPIIVHFDLGGSKISALAGIVDDKGELTILGEEKQESDDIKSGVIERITPVAYKINELAKLLQNSLRIDPIGVVNISLNPKSMRQTFKTVHHPIERAVTNDFLNRIKTEIKASINTDKVYIYEIEALEYFIDGKPTDDPLGKKGEKIRIDYRIVTGNLSIQESTERCFNRTGMEVDYIHLGIDAMSTALLDDKDKEHGCALISFGATSTSLAIYNDGKLQETLIVPLGGINITKDIQELGIRYEYAELLKCKKGYAAVKYVKDTLHVKAPCEDPEKDPILISTLFLAQIIEARLTEILEPILNTLNQISYRLQNGIIITGGASKLEYLDEFLSEKTGFQVRKGDHKDWLSDETHPKFSQPEYSQAIGSILLSHDKNEEKKVKNSPKSEPKIKRVLKGLFNKLDDGVGTIFTYDELEPIKK